MLSTNWFVSGHEFTRAAKAAKSTSGFSPCQLRTRLAGKSWANFVHSFHLLVFPCFRRVRHSRWRIQLRGVLQRIPRELVSPLALFVSASVICLAVRDSRGGVGVRCQIVEFCGLIV
jgi:hypothetical protein